MSRKNNQGWTFQEAEKLLFLATILQLQGDFTPFTFYSFLEGGYLSSYGETFIGGRVARPTSAALRAGL